MGRTPKTFREELEFVRKYCLARTFPADSERCPYSKTKMLGRHEYKTATGDTNMRDPEAMYLCRYPDRQMSTDSAALIRGLEECPDTERRKMIDALELLPA
jgi:hypothetical protein